MIRCYIEKKSRRWDKDIPLLSMALHSMVNRQTGYTPNKLMLGRETIQPVQLLLGIPQQLPLVDYLPVSRPNGQDPVVLDIVVGCLKVIVQVE
jgi:hypothetical protein